MSDTRTLPPPHPGRVDCASLQKHFPDGTEALGSVDLTLPAGKFTVLLGPSGCGKTTLLRCIAGLEIPTRGSIAIDDRDITEEHPAKRNVAMVFQNYALYPNKTVYANIEFPLKLAKVPRGLRREKVNHIAERLQLTSLLNRKPAQLSGGQKQRVGIGRALVRDPRVLLMDEPLSNLDAALRNTMRVELRALQRETGATVVYVTHDQYEALALADQLVVMSRGKVEQIGTPSSVYTRPRTAFVAGFLGGTNLLHGHTRVDRHFVTAGATRLEIPRLPRTLVGHDLILGIRREAFSVVPVSGENLVVSGQVLLSELLGQEQLVHLDIGGGETIAATLPADIPISEHVELFAARTSLQWFRADGNAADLDLTTRHSAVSELLIDSDVTTA